MSRRFILVMGLASVLSNAGCCAWSDRWCHRNQPAPAQYCTPQPACAPPPQCYAPQQAPYCPPPPPNGYYR